MCRSSLTVRNCFVLGRTVSGPRVIADHLFPAQACDIGHAIDSGRTGRTLERVTRLRVALGQLNPIVGDLEGNADRIIEALGRGGGSRRGPGRVPRAGHHRLPPRGPAAQARLRRRQPGRPGQGGGRHRAVRRRGRLRRRAPPTCTTPPRCAPTATSDRHPPQGGAAQLRGLRRAALLRARSRRHPAVVDRGRPGRGVGVRGRLEPVGPHRRPGRRRRRAGGQHQRLPLLRGPAASSGSGCSPPGPRTRPPPWCTSTASAARTSWSSTGRRWSSTPTGACWPSLPQFEETVRGPRLDVRPGVPQAAARSPRPAARPTPLPVTVITAAPRQRARRPATAAPRAEAPRPRGRGLDRRWSPARGTTSRRTASPTWSSACRAGIDSSIVAAIAADALGPDRVHGVSMPSRYSSEGSNTDAADLADRLGIDYRTVAIEDAHAALWDMLEPCLDGAPPGPDRREPAEPDPGRDAHGPVQRPGLAGPHHRQQERGGRRLLDALRRHGRRLRGDQGRAQDPGLPPVRVAQHDRARSFPRPCSPSRRRPSCGPTSATTRASRPTTCSTRSSPPTSRSDMTARRAGRGRLRRGDRGPHRAPHRHRRVQAPPDPAGGAGTPKAFGRDRRVPITNRYR